MPQTTIRIFTGQRRAEIRGCQEAIRKLTRAILGTIAIIALTGDNEIL